MLEEINQKLIELKEKLRAKQKMIQKVKAGEQELSMVKARLVELETILEKEGRDVEKLKGLSLTGLFYNILGNREEQHEKERQEYLAAKLKHDQCKDSFVMLQNQLEELKKEITGLGDIGILYQNTIKEKERLILSSGNKTTQRLIQISEKIADINSDIKELKEAINTGEEALTGIDAVIDSLQSAKGWGTWDLLGGGLISTAIKHSRIDDARQAVHGVQHQLCLFQKELNDVSPYLDSELVIDMGSFATFADYFFDGLITDWIVQSRINDSLENAVNVGNKVLEVFKALQKTLDKKQHELKILYNQRQEIIETFQ